MGGGEGGGGGGGWPPPTFQKPLHPGPNLNRALCLPGNQGHFFVLESSIVAAGRTVHLAGLAPARVLLAGRSRITNGLASFPLAIIEPDKQKGKKLSVLLFPWPSSSATAVLFWRVEKLR